MKKKVKANTIRIKVLMMSKGIKQRDIAKRLGVTPTAVNFEISGKQCSEKVRIGIAQILGAEVGYLFEEV